MRSSVGSNDPLRPPLPRAAGGRSQNQTATYRNPAGPHRERAGFATHIAAICAQLVIALSIAFVWIVRLPNVTNEFREYGLPDLIRNTVGAAKISLATLLVAGIWFPSLVLVSALLMAALMVCAQVAHLRAKHAWQKFMPSLGLLLLSLFVAAVYSGKLPS